MPYTSHQLDLGQILYSHNKSPIPSSVATFDFSSEIFHSEIPSVIGNITEFRSELQKIKNSEENVSKEKFWNIFGIRKFPELLEKFQKSAYFAIKLNET